MEIAATRRRVFNAFDALGALSPEDPRYVNLSAVRGSDRLFRGMVHTILWSNEQTSQLLCGPRGCGKTTELLRLQQELHSHGFFVVYCEADSLVDLNDIGAVDVLLAVMQQIVHAMAATGIPLRLGKSQHFWRELWENTTDLPEAQFDDEVSTLAQLGSALKRNAMTRQMMRQYLRSRSNAFLEAVNSAMESALEGVRNSKFAGLVVIMDSLDRVLRAPVAGMEYTYQEELFLIGAPYLTGIRCHTIYTVPPALLFSPQGMQISTLFSTQPRLLPMVPVCTRSGQPHAAGTDKLAEVIERRLQFAGAPMSEAFYTQETVTRLCRASGGYIRSLIALTRNALLHSDDLPIETEAVEHAIREAREGFTLGIRAEQWEMLRAVEATKTLPDSSESSLQLLDNLTVLNYSDADGSWFDVHPVLREVSQLAGA